MAPRSSLVRSDHIEYGGFLVFDEKGGIRLTRSRPGLAPAERLASFKLTAPRSLWKEPEMRVVVEILDHGDEQKAVADVKAVLNTYSNLEVRVEPRGVVDIVPPAAAQPKPNGKAR